MAKRGNFLSDLQRRILTFEERPQVEKVGHVVEVGDGVARISGLTEAAYGEVILFPQEIKGLVFNLEENLIGAIILGDFKRLQEGDEVRLSGQTLQVPVGEALIGRVVDPLGQPLDEKGPLDLTTRLPLEKVAPGVVKRAPVDTPLQTGIMVIDSLIPIGRGQRELLIGDRQTGKTAITLDAIINQKGKKMICIYVAIGQKTSQVNRVVEVFKKHQAMGHTIVLAANAGDPAALQYLAPYAGCAMGEYFSQKGQDALVVYDDLTKHAWAYRQLSLVLGRPTGREAYPGDIFYLHSRLLERAGRWKEGGSLTALPIVETQASDISAFIPTNVISITDGQIYLDPDLFYAGVRPAVNIGLSVSRVGGEAQIPAMKKLVGQLRLELAQYRELEAFAQFGSELDKATQEQLNRGERLTELLKQPQFQPLPVGEQIILIWVGINNLLKDKTVEEIGSWKEEFLNFIREKHPTFPEEVVEKKMSEKIEKKLNQVFEEFDGLQSKKD